MGVWLTSRLAPASSVPSLVDKHLFFAGPTKRWYRLFSGPRAEGVLQVRPPSLLRINSPYQSWKLAPRYQSKRAGTLRISGPCGCDCKMCAFHVRAPHWFTVMLQMKYAAIP
jgi:hypothetical protein